MPGPLQGGLPRLRKDPVQWGVAWWAPLRCFEILLIRGAGNQPSAQAPQWKLVLSVTQAFVCAQCLFLSVAMTSANDQQTSTSHTRCAATSLCKWLFGSSSGMFLPHPEGCLLLTCFLTFPACTALHRRHARRTPTSKSPLSSSLQAWGRGKRQCLHLPQRVKVHHVK